MKLALKAGLFFLITTTSLLVVRAHAQNPVNEEIKRPPIVGVSHIGLNTDDMDASRKFYTGMLGFEEAFSMNKPDGSLMLTNFKVTDHQFIQVFPELTSSTQDRLNHICFETTDPEQLLTYMSSKGVADLPATKLESGNTGTLAIEIHAPDGHPTACCQYLT